jgi:hypothetical protein
MLPVLDRCEGPIRDPGDLSYRIVWVGMMLTSSFHCHDDGVHDDGNYGEVARCYQDCSSLSRSEVHGSRFYSDYIVVRVIRSGSATEALVSLEPRHWRGMTFSQKEGCRRVPDHLAIVRDNLRTPNPHQMVCERSMEQQRYVVRRDRNGATEMSLLQE